MIRGFAVRGAIVVMAVSLVGCATTPADTPSLPAGPSPTDVATSDPAETDAGAAEPTAAPDASASPDDPVTGDPLLDLQLVDVRTGEPFTLGALAADAPVLVETMAIWCINCRSQQRQVVGAHDMATFHSVSIDVDPNERADDLAEYSDREGFDWPFVLADAELATMLRERFTPAVLNPPSMPKLLVIADGRVEMVGLNEQLSAEAIAALVDG